MAATSGKRKRAAAAAGPSDVALPRWEESLSFRGMNYRYAAHQGDVMGTMKARVVEARDLRRLDWSYLQPLASAKHVNAYVKVGLGGRHAGGEPICTSVVRNNCNPTWARQEFLMPVLKSRVRPGVVVSLDVQAFHSESVVTSVLPQMITGHNSLGLGQVELTPLLLGETMVLDVWVPLVTGAEAKNAHSKGGAGGKSGKGGDDGFEGPGGKAGKAGARAAEVDQVGPAVHIVVEYEAEGMQPQRGDVVYPEPFARSPVNQVVPLGEPLCVLDTSGTSVLVGFMSPHSEFKCQMKMHRNAVFVVERLSLVDGIWSRALQPTDYIFGTELGHYLRSVSGPYVNYVNTLLTPVYMASNVGLGTLRLALRSAAAGVTASGSTVLGNDRRFVRRARR